MIQSFAAVAVLVTSSCTQTKMTSPSSLIVDDLRVLNGRTVYFGHQSVGANILQGIREITPPGSGGPLITDTFIGENGDPAGKCTDFTRKMEQAVAVHPDIALMKFCYIDFDQNTNPGTLFAEYSQTIDSLRSRYPSITFIPVTAPLMARSALWKRLVRRLLGEADAGAAGNAKRAEFNNMLGAHYAGQPVFDLALVESTLPDGSRNQFEYEGKTAYALADGYTDDGGHLNAAGRGRAAEAFLHALAQAARGSGAGRKGA